MNAAADRRAFLAILPAGALLSSWGAQASGTGTEPVYAAIEAHQAAYDALMDAWNTTGSVRWRDDLDEAEKAELRRVRVLEQMEEQTHNALLLIRPNTKAAAVAAVQHIAEYGLATVEIQAWLTMLLESPLVA
jgi:hypothetical protein